ncbi:M20/M25/M40 family metallo-hydrolase [Paenibacillus kobensis]|uniref:M20/M25/M40 family metallo-hydrolase n=1 Tax=Paenibacillus kobensis TaxID=59841 RepID=UPI0013E3C25B|nr:M20/M25/M40 family metallo-hydrolase [Paenibacillus kobensis]
MNRLERDLYELLSITAPSGMERPVADYLIRRLKRVVDRVDQDDYGNVVAEAQFGSGTGPAILLCAHMDTVWVDPERAIIRQGGIWSSSSGPLGADDRAGIAIILDVLRKLAGDASFQGRIKLAFTREEEIGRIGSNRIDLSWLTDVELCIVIDRRGSRDIVVRNSGMSFCDPVTGHYFETAGALCGMSDWQTVQGGLSDAVTFAGYGIPSVNLSAGYQHEHTEAEYVNVRHCQDTVNLIVQALLGLRIERAA